MTIERVEITCRHGTYGGIKAGRVAAFDYEIPARFPVKGVGRTQRSFVLLDEHVQLQEPLSFPAELDGWWYVDLVEVRESGSAIVVADHWLDVVVPPPGQPYQIRDLGEFGDALLAGDLSADQARAGLARFQGFIDTYLHGPERATKHSDLAQRWYDFPPAALAPLANAEI